MSTAIDTEQQVHRALAVHGAKSAVQAFVAVFRTTPNRIFNGTMNIILGIALYYEHTSIFKVPFKIFRVIAVSSFQFFKDRMGLTARNGVGLGAAS